MGQSTPERQVLIEAFLLRLATDPAISEEHLPAFRAQVTSILDGVKTSPQAITHADVQYFVEARGALGETRQSRKNLSTAGAAWIAFVNAPDHAQWVAQVRASGRPDAVAPPAYPSPGSAPLIRESAGASLLNDDRSNDGSLSDARRWVAHPYTMAGVAMALGAASPILVNYVPVLGVVSGILRWAATMAAFYSIVNHVSRGREGMPMLGTDSDPLGIGLPQLFRALGTAVVLLGPALFLSFWVATNAEWDVGVLLFSITVLGVAAALGPAAVVCGEVTGSGWTAMYPLAWVRMIWRMPKDYAAVARWAVPIMFGIGAWEVVVQAFGHSALIRFPLAALGNLLWFSLAALIGRLIHLHEDDFGLRSSKHRQYDASLRPDR